MGRRHRRHARKLAAAAEAVPDTLKDDIRFAHANIAALPRRSAAPSRIAKSRSSPA
jgi:hypothetical protein